MWISVLRHVVGQHVWQDGQCAHAIDVASDSTVYIAPDSNAMVCLRQVVLDRALLQDMRYYRHFMHTFQLESFHNEMLAYVPKRVHFGYEAMKARTFLSAIDHNHHVNRQQKVGKSGVAQRTRKWSKRGKKWVSVFIVEKKSYKFVPYIMYAVLCKRRCETECYKKRKRVVDNSHPLNIAKNLADYEGPSSKQLAEDHLSRFKK